MHNAYRQVRTAIKNGTLVRPEFCSRCGAADTIGRSGRHTIQAHHYKGYDHPLTVEWLCAKCHRVETPLPSAPGGTSNGESNGQAKLLQSQVDEIRSSPLGCRKLSRIYSVDKRTIQRIRNGTQWKS